MINLRKLLNLEKKDLVTKGIIEEKVFSGPRILQLDITNDCNLNCIGCWCHSELMKESKFDENTKKVRLPIDKIKPLIDELKSLGVEEIQLSGSGDPTMHQDFIQIVKHIKSRDLKLHIITNFTLLTKADIDSIVTCNVEKITVSVWAGDAATYAKTHPNQKSRIFFRLKENLEYLQMLKKNRKKDFPFVRIYNVISSENCDNIGEMIDFGLEVFADYIEFQVVDIVEGKSDKLSLTESQRDSVIMQFDDYAKEYGTPGHLRKESGAKEQEELISFVNPKSFQNGFTYEIGGPKSTYVKCQRGFRQDRIKLERKNSTMKFYFNKKICTSCDRLKECSIDKENYSVDFKTLSILGIGTFKRRLSTISGAGRQNYDIKIVDSIPCYIGWIFARVLPDGSVIPCCKAHKKPLGNLYDNTFSEIWNSHKYNEFRRLAKNEKKSHPYFKEIGCYKSCDNVGMNLDMHKEMKND